MTQGWPASRYAAWALWLLGYPDQALQRSHEALTLAQELSHPFSLACCPDSVLPCSISSAGRGRPPKSGPRPPWRSATEQGFPFWVAWGTILRGWALAEQGHEAEGMAQMRQGLAAYRATGQRSFRPYYLALLAEAYGQGGQAEEGLQRCWPRRWRWWTQHGERYYEAELYRLKGELLLQQASSTRQSAEAEELFSSGPRHCPPPAGEVAGAAGGHEPEPAVAAPGQAR